MKMKKKKTSGNYCCSDMISGDKTQEVAAGNSLAENVR